MLAATWKMPESSFHLSQRVVCYVGKVCSCVPGDPESNRGRTVLFLETSDFTNPTSRSSCPRLVKRLLLDSLGQGIVSLMAAVALDCTRTILPPWD